MEGDSSTLRLEFHPKIKLTAFFKQGEMSGGWAKESWLQGNTSGSKGQSTCQCQLKVMPPPVSRPLSSSPRPLVLARSDHKASYRAEVQFTEDVL